jgi:arginine/lysine/ornithine decarboxylase
MFKQSFRVNEIIKEEWETHRIKTIIIAIEELSELQKELCKMLRGSANNKNLVEELADVVIMLQAIQTIFKIHDLNVLEQVTLKESRTLELIKKDNLWG